MFFPSNLAVALILMQSAPEAVGEQSRFSAVDENVKRPVDLPPGVVAILAKNAGVKDVIESLGLPPERLPLSWFLASEIHLSGRNEKDLVVVGTGAIMGANVTTFWIFRPRHGGFELLLDAAPALELVIKDSRSHGYRDVELSAATAVTASTVLLKFDGRGYRMYSNSLEPIN